MAHGRGPTKSRDPSGLPMSSRREREVSGGGCMVGFSPFGPCTNSQESRLAVV